MINILTKSLEETYLKLYHYTSLLLSKITTNSQMIKILADPQKIMCSKHK